MQVVVQRDSSGFFKVNATHAIGQIQSNLYAKVKKYLNILIEACVWGVIGSKFYAQQNFNLRRLDFPARIS